ncbi:hypothetical protein [Haloarchaeobius iranensis]|nr:hypothetical protein [Haloarchaeobius iranensis]
MTEPVVVVVGGGTAGSVLVNSLVRLLDGVGTAGPSPGGQTTS